MFIDKVAPKLTKNQNMSPMVNCGSTKHIEALKEP